MVIDVTKILCIVCHLSSEAAEDENKNFENKDWKLILRWEKWEQIWSTSTVCSSPLDHVYANCFMQKFLKDANVTIN